MTPRGWHENAGKNSVLGGFSRFGRVTPKGRDLCRELAAARRDFGLDALPLPFVQIEADQQSGEYQPQGRDVDLYQYPREDCSARCAVEEEVPALASVGSNFRRVAQNCSASRCQLAEVVFWIKPTGFNL